MKSALAFLSCLLLAACGFQLRGTASLPFETLYLPSASAGIALDLKRSIQSGTATRVVDDAKAGNVEAMIQAAKETRAM